MRYFKRNNLGNFSGDVLDNSRHHPTRMELVPVECKGLVILYSMISHITPFPDCIVWLKADQQEEHEFIGYCFISLLFR